MNAPALEGRRNRAKSGFTLIEVAVVVFVVALLLSGILIPLSFQVEQRQYADAQRQLQDIREAIIGYALAQMVPALPCPDLTAAVASFTPNDGIEDVDASTGTCAAINGEGNVPWVTLGTSPSDPWGNRYRYRVTPGMAQRPPAAPFTLNSPNGDLEVVCLASGLPALPDCIPGQRVTDTRNTANATVAVILSHGPNGWGGINASTNALNLPAGCVSVVGCAQMSGNEIENANGDFFFVAREPSPAGSMAGVFDDVIVWLSPHTLKHRVVAAGKLP